MTDLLANLRRGRTEFEQRAWAETYRLQQAADCDAPLDAEDLERLAIAAHLAGRDDECETVTARAHQAFLERGDREGAARAAFWLGFSLMERGAIAPASGWFVRAGRQISMVLKEMGHEPMCLLTDVTGEPYWTIIAEAKVEKIDDFFAMEHTLMTSETLQKTMADYHDLVASGRREIYRIES